MGREGWRVSPVAAGRTVTTTVIGTVVMVAALLLAACGSSGTGAAVSSLPATSAPTTAAPPRATAPPSPSGAELQVVAAGVHQVNGESRWSGNWAVVVHNPDAGAAATDVRMTLDLVDGSGKVVRSEEKDLVEVWPGASGAVAGLSDAPGAVRVAVRITAVSWVAQDAGSLPLHVGPITTGVVPPFENGKPDQTMVSGEVSSSWPEPIGATVTVVFVAPDGSVQGGADEVLPGTVPAGGSAPWGTLVPEPLPPDWTLHAYANPSAATRARVPPHA